MTTESLTAGSPTASPLCFAEPRAAYIHVPFCIHRCGYCDFTVVARKDHLIDGYLQAIERELTALGTPQPMMTLFIGGGTPTHLAPVQLDRLLKQALRWLPLSPGAEFSVEANPAGLTREKISVLQSHGVNRISLGVQSFDSDILRTLERDHDQRQIENVAELLRDTIPNFSIDLIFGVPGQSLELWQATLRQGIALRPRHVSTYGLTYEKGTAFWGRREKGALLPAPEETEREMYAAAMDELSAAGYLQYELSNFGRPGFECRHNQVYWSGQPYLAFGPGAARYVNGRRETNHRSVTTWLKRVLAGDSAVAESETLSPEDRARECAVLGLRTMAGVLRSDFPQQTGYRLEDLAASAIEKYTKLGLLEDDGERLRLTREGRFVADSVIVDFL